MILSPKNSGALYLDRVGLITAGVCAVHCVVMPLLLTAVPLVGLQFLAEDRVEQVLIGLSATIGLVSLVPAALCRHRKTQPLVMFAAGLILLIISSRFEDRLSVELPLIVFGALLVGVAHISNRRLSQACLNCELTGPTS